MPVTYLELENFKSYAGFQRIGPFKNFSSVIGPNGSGKSNLMDAISFILGVKSRDLRSSQMKDLIFRPPGDQDDDIENNSNQNKRKACATLVYSNPDDNDTETRYSRVISSKGVGEYKINDKTVTFAQYEEALADIGVLLKGRNFLVFQGDVETTARKTPKELTQWFEDISNSSELKDSYDEAFKALTDAETQVRNASQKQKGYWKMKRELKSQKEEAEKFRSLLDTKAAMLTEYFVWQLYHIKTDMDEKETSIEELNEEVEDSNKIVTNNAKLLRTTKKDASAARSVANASERKRVDLAADVDRNEPSRIKIQEEIKNLKKKVTAETKKFEKIKSDEESRDETVERLEQDIKEYTETETQLEKEYEETKQAVATSKGNTALSQEQEAEYEEIRDAVAVASAKPREVLNMANRKLDSARAKAASLTEELKELKSRKADSTSKLKDFIERKESLEKNVEKTETDLKTAKEELQDAQKSLREDETKKKEIDLELEKINHNLRELRDDRRKNQHEAKLEEAIASLKRYFPGVKDRLVKLCQPTQKRFDLGVTVAGGKDMDAVVVDTKQTAFDCIQYLRSNQVGTATFLPLDSLEIPNPESTERIRAMVEHDGRYRLTCDIIACDETVKKAVMYAVGNSVVCDDLDCARELCFGQQNRRQRNQEARIKAVTIGGAVISKAGTMTGGVSHDERSRAGRWDDREAEKLRKRKEELETQRADLDKSDSVTSQGSRRASRGCQHSRIEELRSSVGNLTNRLQYMKSNFEFTLNKQKEHAVLISSITSQVEKTEKKLEDAESQVDATKKDVKKAIADVKEVEEKYFGPFLEKTGIEDFRAYDNSIGEAREEFRKKRKTIKEHLEKLKAQKIYEEGRKIKEDIIKKQNSLDMYKKKLTDAESREKDIMASVAESRAKLAEVELELEECRRVEKENDELVKNALKIYKESQTAQANLAKSLNTEESNLERLRAKLHETLQKARVEEADVQLVDSNSNKASDMSSRSSRAARRSIDDTEDDIGGNGSQDIAEGSQTSSLVMTQESSLSTHFSQADDSRVIKDRNESNKIDYSHLRRELKQRRSDRETSKIQKDFETNLEKLTEQVESMTPNMRASEAFDNVIDQLDECNEDFGKAKDSAKKASRRFNQIKRDRTDKFNSAFQHVADALTNIYKDMTKSSKHPLGGKAYLSLDDSEEPYNGGIKFTAMPPMKRYRDMEYLSGGEKTIAALALLFAIHSFHPAPFFVMDEVDAALDNINVLKLCNYIKHRSADFQCIVISLKDTFYEQSNGLVGICRDVSTNSSRTLTLDLTKFDKEEEESGQRGKKRGRNSSSEPRKRSSSSQGALQ